MLCHMISCHIAQSTNGLKWRDQQYLYHTRRQQSQHTSANHANLKLLNFTVVYTGVIAKLSVCM